MSSTRKTSGWRPLGGPALAAVLFLLGCVWLGLALRARCNHLAMPARAPRAGGPPAPHNDCEKTQGQQSWKILALRNGERLNFALAHDLKARKALALMMREFCPGVRHVDDARLADACAKVVERRIAEEFKLIQSDDLRTHAALVALLGRLCPETQRLAYSAMPAACAAAVTRGERAFGENEGRAAIKSWRGGE